MDKQTFTVTDEDLLNVYLSGISSGIGTWISHVSPGTGRATAELVARSVRHRIGHDLQEDPAFRLEVLAMLHDVLSRRPGPGTWVRPMRAPESR